MTSAILKKMIFFVDNGASPVPHNHGCKKNKMESQILDFVRLQIDRRPVSLKTTGVARYASPPKCHTVCELCLP